MYQDNYYVDKSTGTFADVLETYGLARILSIIAESDDVLLPLEIRIYDEESHYRIELSEPVSEDQVAKARFGVAHKYVETSGKPAPDPAIPSDDLGLQYQRLNQRKALFDSRSSKAKGKRTAEQLELTKEQEKAIEAWKPHTYYPIWNALTKPNLKAIDAYNDAVIRWHKMHEHFTSLLHILLLRYSATPNLVSESEELWQQLRKDTKNNVPEYGLSSVQMYNPGRGKGVNKEKPTGASRGQISDFWVAEYLKHAGMYMAGIIQKLELGKDRKEKYYKTYVLSPRDLGLNQHGQIFERFRATFRWIDHPLKTDVLAVLGYTRAFLDYIGERYKQSQPITLIPSEAVAGFQTALYKNLGKADVVMNLSFIHLPGWVAPDSRVQIQPFQAILQEHGQVVKQLGHDEQDDFQARGDVLDLLRDYRDFLSANDLEPFFRFTSAYSQYLTQAIDKEWKYKTFTTENLRRMVIMGEQNLRGEQDLQEIIDSNGFRHVATAIRRSTVSLQRKKVRVKQGKAQPDEIAYEIRYGLGTDLSRSAATNKRDVFIQALTEFLSKYSAESARVYERTDGRQDRAFVSTSDLEEVVKLVDKFGAKTVCSLLVAYGYASDWKGKSEEDDTTEQITEEADNE